MKKIKLTNGMDCLIDDEDFEEVSKHNWSINHYGYARTSRGRNNRPLLHREIMKAQKGQFVDHINGDKLDNRKANLRICTNSENIRNGKKKVTNKSGYKGVSWSKRMGAWCSQITFNRKSINLGHFDDKEYAARVYDIWAIWYFGEFALTNKKLGLLS